VLGAGDALSSDPCLRRVVRPDPWLGARLLRRHHEKTIAADLMRWLDQRPDQHEAEELQRQWLLLNTNEPEGWRALLELGMRMKDVPLLRAEPFRLASVDIVDVEECAGRLGRLARLTNARLVVDVTRAVDMDGSDEWLRRFLAAVGRTHARAALIATDETHAVRQLGAMSFQLRNEDPLSQAARIAAMRAAAEAADILVTTDTVSELASRHPLAIDALEQATNLAVGRPRDFTADDPSLTRFTTALKDVASEGLSHLAERIEPVFNLDDVVLPSDRHRQLVEIVDNVRFASRVLDDWKFGAQLPYGRGVTALFHGASGTGKTMAAIGIAQRLGIQILRLDLSKVVSKYIGDTEKAIDRVFSEAERTGSAILIDEAESLVAKRSEVRDAHDRYANIEVAFLLTRMEAFGSKRPCGPAILTTNMRQALDPAFLRRLRFIIEFPRPTVDARERIWRQCLPAGSHTLDDAAFKQLARRVDLTGGHLRQITLRAAFLAAAAGTLITLSEIAQATNAELAKLGMPAVDLDLKPAREAA
jgi:SpoVK/Ycf46/Vps4 family AAA+-type ATPase